jgi:hypothetical protein
MEKSFQSEVVQNEGAPCDMENSMEIDDYLDSSDSSQSDEEQPSESGEAEEAVEVVGAAAETEPKSQPVKVKEMNRASNTPRGVMYIERKHVAPRKQEDTREDRLTVRGHVVKRQRGPDIAPEYSLAPRRIDEVIMLGITRNTVDVFRDLPPSHIGGLLLNKVTELGDQPFCDHCGAAGHAENVCREPSTCVKVVYSSGTNSSGSGSDVVAIVLGCRSLRHSISECPYTSCTLCSGQHNRTACRLYKEPASRTTAPERKHSPYGGRGKGARGKGGKGARGGKGGKGGKGNRGKGNRGKGGDYRGNLERRGNGADSSTTPYHQELNAGEFHEQATILPSSPTYVPSSPEYATQFFNDDFINIP